MIYKKMSRFHLRRKLLLLRIVLRFIHPRISELRKQGPVEGGAAFFSCQRLRQVFLPFGGVKHLTESPVGKRLTDLQSAPGEILIKLLKI